jgi:hypothetical protein
MQTDKLPTTEERLVQTRNKETAGQQIGGDGDFSLSKRTEGKSFQVADKRKKRRQAHTAVMHKRPRSGRDSQKHRPYLFAQMIRTLLLAKTD